MLKIFFYFLNGRQKIFSKKFLIKSLIKFYIIKRIFKNFLTIILNWVHYILVINGIDF
jgi:hypothetical protein